MVVSSGKSRFFYNAHEISCLTVGQHALQEAHFNSARHSPAFSSLFALFGGKSSDERHSGLDGLDPNSELLYISNLMMTCRF